MSKKVRILIVEDEFIIAQDIQSTLHNAGYDVPTILSTAEGILDRIKEEQPELILMDVNLEGSLDGIQAAQMIRDTFHTPVLFLTSYTDEATIERAKKTEPFGYIVKPFQQNELRTTIEMALHKAKMDQKLRESQEWLSAVLRSIPDGVVAVDRAGQVTFMNAVAERLCGITQAEAQGKHFDAVVSLKNERLGTAVRSPVAEVVDLENGVRIGNLVLASRKGDEIPIEESWTPMKDPKGKTTGAVLVFRDVREKRKGESRRRELEAQVLHVQKLESIGVLTGGIAHDFNNLLCIILGNASLALSENLPIETIREKVKLIELTSLRATDLVKQILSYSGKGQIVMQMANLSHVVGEMGTLLQTSISKKVELEYRFDPEMPVFLADVVQLRQVIMNLIINASDAIGDQRGKVTVTTGTLELGPDGTINLSGAGASKDVAGPKSSETFIGQGVLPGKYVYLEVRDTGVGMDAATKAKIFDPFFTTKFSGRGLGLAVVLGIVRAHSGAISLDTEPGRGTSFRIVFPVGSTSQLVSFEDRLSPQAVEHHPMPQAQSLQASGTILVVDDEGQLLTIVREILEHEGYQVITANNGTEGLEEFTKGKNEISAVLLDMSMPDLDGAETLSRMRSIKSDVKVILTSGYHEEEIISRLAAYSIKHFLQKPYQPQTLLGKVSEALTQV